MRKAALLLLSATVAMSQTMQESYDSYKASQGITVDATTSKAITNQKTLNDMKTAAQAMIVSADEEYITAEATYKSQMEELTAAKTEFDRISVQHKDLKSAVTTAKKNYDDLQASKTAAMREAEAGFSAKTDRLATVNQEIESVRTEIKNLTAAGTEIPAELQDRALALAQEKQGLDMEVTAAKQEVASIGATYDARIKAAKETYDNTLANMAKVSEDYAQLEELAGDATALEIEYKLNLDNAKLARDTMIAQANSIIAQIESGNVQETQAQQMARELGEANERASKIDVNLPIYTDLSEQQFINEMRKQGYSDDTFVGYVTGFRGNYRRPTARAQQIMQAIAHVMQDDKRSGKRLGTNYNDANGLSQLATFKPTGSIDKYGRVARVNTAESLMRSKGYSSNLYMGEATAMALWRRTTFDRKVFVPLSKEIKAILAAAKEDADKDLRGLDAKSNKAASNNEQQTMRANVQMKSKLDERALDTTELREQGKKRQVVDGADKYDVTGRVTNIRGGELRKDTQDRVTTRMRDLSLKDTPVNKLSVAPTKDTELSDYDARLNTVSDGLTREDTRASVAARMAETKANLAKTQASKEPELSTNVVTRA